MEEYYSVTELGEGPGPSSYFWTRLRPKGPKNFRLCPFYLSQAQFSGNSPPLPTHTHKKTGRIKHSINMVFDTHTQVQKTIIRGEGAQQWLLQKFMTFQIAASFHSTNSLLTYYLCYIASIINKKFKLCIADFVNIHVKGIHFHFSSWPLAIHG